MNLIIKHEIEFLGADEEVFKLKFINILKEKSLYSTLDLKNIYENLLQNIPQTLIINCTLEEVNKTLIQCSYLHLRTGYLSFHEENQN